MNDDRIREVNEIRFDRPVTFRTADDAIPEGTETAALSLSAPSAGITLGATTTQNIAIANNDGTLDGNMDVGVDATNPVNLFFRASVLNTASVDGSGGAPAGS